METVHFRVPLEDSKDPRALAKALDELVRLSSKLAKKIDDETMYVKSTFHTPQKKWIRERVFFERCSKHPELDQKTLAYVHRLWGHEVVLETSVNGKRTFLTFGDRGFSAKAAK